MKFRKKPVVIEAVQLALVERTEEGSKEAPFSESPDWLIKAVMDEIVYYKTIHESDYVHMVIKTLEGEMLVSPNDWIIRGVNGELYPCKPDIFEKTYEAVEE